MIARAQAGWRHGAEAALAVLMVAVLLWAGGMLDAGRHAREGSAPRRTW